MLRTGEPYRTKSYVKYAALVDQPIPQLLLQVAVYEVEVSKEMRLGLDYIAWKNGPGRNLFEFIAWGSHRTPPVPGDASGSYGSANYLLTSAYVDFLQGTGRARLVTRGKVLIKNSETGTLAAVDEVLHFLVQPNESNTPISGIDPTSPVTHAEYIGEEEEEEQDPDVLVHNRTLDKDAILEIGFVLQARPMIAKQTTELQIHLALNNIVGQTPSGTPQVRTHTLSSTVLVRDGQPFCLSGLRRTEDVKNTAKMPILGSIPILGYLFGHEANVQRETEMVVVLTPKIRLGTEADLEMASEQDVLVRAQVERRAKLSVPKTQFGFDQWLIGED